MEIHYYGIENIHTYNDSHGNMVKSIQKLMK